VKAGARTAQDGVHPGSLQAFQRCLAQSLSASRNSIPLPVLASSGLVQLKDERVAFTHDLSRLIGRMRVLWPTVSIRRRSICPCSVSALAQAHQLFGQRILDTLTVT